MNTSSNITLTSTCPAGKTAIGRTISVANNGGVREYTADAFTSVSGGTNNAWTMSVKGSSDPVTMRAICI